MRIRIAGIESESVVDGEGLRFAIFMQGCLRRCKGCHNPKAQALNGGRFVDTSEIITAVQNNPLLDGITLTGGEPFLQIDAVNEIARRTKDLGLSVWCYTGFTYDEIQSHWLKYIDVLVDGAYIENLRDLELQFRGSSNQRIIDVKKSLEQQEVVLKELTKC